MYDVIIVGAGSAGCVLANRLSADPSRRVLLLEAGPPDSHPWLSIPAGFAKIPAGSPFNWGYFTEPEPRLGGRPVYWPRGKTLGGSSAINAMVYLRGHAADYDSWRAAGNVGWGWTDVLPYFRRGEDFEGGAGPAHGAGGELGVTGPVFRHPASIAFLAACREAGVPEVADLNDGKLGGAGFLHFTIKDGVRQSASRSHLRPARERANLRVVTDAHVQALQISGRRVEGVSYISKGARHGVTAREVILCAGALNSPQLLLLSGIGPAAELQALGLEVRHDLPGVGRNLQDHLYVTCSGRTHTGGSLNRELRGARLVAQALRYVLTRRGPLALGASQVSAFLRSRPDLTAPDLQVNFTPLSYHLTESGEVAIDHDPGFTVAVAHLQPRSYGRVTLQSADPGAAPRIEANYLSDPQDEAAVLEGLRWIRRILAQPAFAATVAGPGIPNFGAASDDDLLEFVRATAGSLFHPVGTCRMGQDAAAVTDERLRVRGLQGLRVADASIMPQIIAAPTNATAMMIGERAADLVTEDLRRGR